MDAIVFDWDGTLVDSLAAIYDANLQVLTELGLPFDDARYRAAYTPDWRVMYQRLGVAERDLETAGDRWLELYRAVDPSIVPFPGVREALERLSAAGFAMGLVTAGDRPVVEDQLERFGLAELLPVRVCGTDGLAQKPHPEPLLTALGRLGVRERAVHARYVGDAPDDMRMARSVGARAIGIVSPLSGAAELAAAGAAETHASVAAWVGTFLGGAVGADRSESRTR